MDFVFNLLNKNLLSAFENIGAVMILMMKSATQ